MLVDRMCERYASDANNCKIICRRIGRIFVFFVLLVLSILITILWLQYIKIFDLNNPMISELSVNDQDYYNSFFHPSADITSKVLLYRDKSQQWLNMLKHNHEFKYDPDSMTLSSNKFYERNCFKYQPYIANGYIGCKISNLGFGFTYDQNIPSIDNGWPLHNKRYTGSFVSDFYSLQSSLPATNFPELDNDGFSSVISSIPYYNDMIFEFDGLNDTKTLNPSNILSYSNGKITNYQQSLSMKNGIVKTSYTWLDLIHFEIESIANKKYYTMSTTLINITILNPDLVQNLKIINLLDFDTSERTDLQKIGFKSKDNEIHMVVSPNNVPNTLSNVAVVSKIVISKDLRESIDYNINYELNNDKSAVQQIITFPNNNTFNNNLENLKIYKFVSIHSTEYTNSNNNLEISEKELSNYSTAKDYYHLKNIHINRWFDFYAMNCFIEIPSDILLELSIRSSIFHLISNIREQNILPDRGLPLAPSGLSSDSYGGMVFWDADYWIMPAMVPFFPGSAKNLIIFRNATLPQAIENAKKYDKPGAVYPWTSGRYSNCTSTGPCINYEYHVNIDIIWSTFFYYLSGNYAMEVDQFDDESFLQYTLWPMIHQVAIFFEDYVTYDPFNDQYVTHNLTDPDEFANFIDNGAYTNFGIKMLFVWAVDICRHLEMPVPKKWFDIREKMYVPMNSQNDITLEYSNMNSTVRTKQADVLLNIFPFGIFHKYPNYEKMVNNLYYYSEHQAYDGPAMSYQIYVAVANYLLNKGCSSQSFLYKSLVPYLRLPWAQFSEQANDQDPLTKPAFPFLTANGGFLQSIIYGLTGIRFNYEIDKKTKKIIKFMEFNPIQLKVLPGGITIRNFKYMNGILDIIIGDKVAKINYKFGSRPITIKVPDRTKLKLLDGEYNSIQLFKTHRLRPNTELEIDLFEVEKNMENDLAECQLITNLTVGVPGDVAISMIDGNNYTHWQSINHERATFMLDIGANNEQIISQATILWGGRPAKNISLYILPMDQMNFEEIPFFFEPSDFSSYKDFCQDCDDKETMMNEKVNQLEVLIAMGHFTELDLHKWFIPIAENHIIEPSAPYNKYDSTNDDIKISKNNETTLYFDYGCTDPKKSKAQSKREEEDGETQYSENNEKRNVFDCSNLSKYKSRFVLVSVEGVYGYENGYPSVNNSLLEIPVIETFGATVREIAVF